MNWQEILQGRFIASDEEQTHNAYPFRLPPFIYEAVKETVEEIVTTQLALQAQEVRKQVLEEVKGILRVGEEVYKDDKIPFNAISSRLRTAIDNLQHEAGDK